MRSLGGRGRARPFREADRGIARDIYQLNEYDVNRIDNAVIQFSGSFSAAAAMEWAAAQFDSGPAAVLVYSKTALAEGNAREPGMMLLSIRDTT